MRLSPPEERERKPDGGVERQMDEMKGCSKWRWRDGEGDKDGEVRPAGEGSTMGRDMRKPREKDGDREIRR